MMYPWFRLRRRMMMSAGGLDIASLVITYTGTYTDYGVVTMTDGDYRLLAMTGSGALTIAKPVNCEVCVVGGGSNSASTGGAGAYLTNQSLTAFAGSAVVVGAANGASSIGDVAVTALSAKSKNGGSGGGAYGAYSGGAAGTGDGLSKYPFGDTAYSLWAGKPHCGGGGGTGSYEADSDTGGYACYNGGAGGSNGGNGGKRTVNYLTIKTYWGGAGGAYGGGRGVGKGSAGSSATYYGGGAGGGSSKFSGYQGIVYLRIPTKQ